MVPPARFDAKAIEILESLYRANAGNAWLMASMPYRGNDRRRLNQLKEISRTTGVPLIASNDVLYHAHERRMLQDVVSCIREKTSIEKAGQLLEINAERHLKGGSEMRQLFREAPEAIEETVRFADKIQFSFDQIKYIYPDEPVPPGKTPQRYLEDLVWKGIRKKYQGFKPPRVRKLLRHELAPHPAARLRELFHHRSRHRRACAIDRYSVPGQRIGCQFRGLLCAWA